MGNVTRLLLKSGGLVRDIHTNLALPTHITCRSMRSTFGRRSFTFAIPTIWNDLPTQLCFCSTISICLSYLKLIMFSLRHFSTLKLHWYPAVWTCPPSLDLCFIEGGEPQCSLLGVNQPLNPHTIPLSVYLSVSSQAIPSPVMTAYHYTVLTGYW